MYPTHIEDVFAFNQKFELPTFEVPTLLDIETMRYRVDFLAEELDELAEAYSKSDLVEVVDGLVDLVYVALGTACMMGVTPAQWQACWDAVHHANMQKVRTHDLQSTKRLNLLDVVKPPDWVSPAEALREILKG